MSSKASEWANAYANLLDNRPKFVAEVNPEPDKPSLLSERAHTDEHGWLFVDCGAFSPEDALALARFILDTFGEAP